MFFYSPTQVANKEVPQGKAFRIGGLVEQGSLKRGGDGLTVTFNVTDTAKVIPVTYSGILPDLFKEGKGVVAQGRLGPDGTFRAHEVLAKHDENYMPPEAAHAVEQAHKAQKTVQSRSPTPSQRGAFHDSRDRSLRADPCAADCDWCRRCCRSPAQRAATASGCRWRGRQRAARRSSSRSRTCASSASFVNNDFSVLNVATNSNSQLPLQYRIAASWGSHEGSMLLWVLMLSWWTFAVATFSKHLPDDMVARVIGVQGFVSVGFPALHADDVGSVRPAVSAGARWSGPQPAAAGPGHGVPPADALHGLRRLLGRLRLRDRGAARRQARCGLGALVAPVDDAGVVLPDRGHRARQLVGLLRTRLGRLVVLGPGRKCLVHAVAGRHRADPLAGGDRKARQLQELDRAAGDLARSRCRCSAPSWSARAC